MLVDGRERGGDERTYADVGKAEDAHIVSHGKPASDKFLQRAERNLVGDAENEAREDGISGDERAGGFPSRLKRVGAVNDGAVSERNPVLRREFLGGTDFVRGRPPHPVAEDVQPLV